MDDLRIPPALRWPPRYPRPRDVEVFAEHHCSADCIHITEAHRIGREAGERAEAKRHEGREGVLVLVAVYSFLLGAMAAVTVRLAVLLVGGR